MTETNTERLERLKNIPSHQPFSIPVVDIRKDDIDYLIEQAERVQELEKEVNGLHWRNEWLKSQDENERLREALEVYAKNPIAGIIARKVLEGVSNDQNIET